MALTAAGAFNLSSNIDAPPGLENGAINHQKHPHAQHSADSSVAPSYYRSFRSAVAVHFRLTL